MNSWCNTEQFCSPLWLPTVLSGPLKPLCGEFASRKINKTTHPWQALMSITLQNETCQLLCRCGVKVVIWYSVFSAGQLEAGHRAAACSSTCGTVRVNTGRALSFYLNILGGKAVTHSKHMSNIQFNPVGLELSCRH